MSRERRQEARRIRQRQRRQGKHSTGSTYVPAGQYEMPGMLGFFQRNTRAFFLGGIVVIILSTGAVFFTSDGTSAVDQSDTTPTPEATSSAEATSTAEATPTVEPIQRTYSAAPEQTIDPAKRYEAVLRTTAGDVRIELNPGAAPEHVNNFVFLAQNRFYEGLTFHRVQPGFVAQAGDPSGRGSGGPGYNLTEERNQLPFDAGVISMAKAGTTVSGSQFFITLSPQPLLKADFTAFGKVTSGLDVLQSLQARDPRAADAPQGVEILGIDIVETAPSTP